VRLDGDFQATKLAIPMALEADVVENESGKTLNRVQNGLNLQLNSWSPFRLFALPLNSQITRTVGDQLFLLPPWTTSRRLWAGAASGGDGLPNSCSRRRRSPRVTDSPAPAHRRAGNARTSITKSVKKRLAKTRNQPKIAHRLCGRPGFGLIPGEIVAGVLDCMVMGAMIILLGFHWLFLPTFVVEVIPEIDMLPTWVGCVAYVVWQRKKEQEQPKKEQDNPWGDKIVIDIQEAQNVHEPRPLLTVQASPPLPPQGLDAAKKSLEERLARLNDLLEKKVITQAEYEAKRQEVLNDI
jgi:hypothetical protein